MTIHTIVELIRMHEDELEFIEQRIDISDNLDELPGLLERRYMCNKIIDDLTRDLVDKESATSYLSGKEIKEKCSQL